MQVSDRIRLLLNYTYQGLYFKSAKQVSQIYFYGCIVLSLGSCVPIDNCVVWEQEVLLLCCSLELLSFVLVMGTRCQSIKGSWTRQKDCCSDLLLNSRALALFCLLWKPNIHKHTGQSGISSLPPAEAATAEEAWLRVVPWRGDICHSSLSRPSFWGVGRRGRKKEKGGKKRTCNLHIHRDFPYVVIATSSRLHSLSWVFGISFLVKMGNRSEVLFSFAFYFSITRVLFFFFFFCSYNAYVIYCICHFICLGKMV